MTPILSQNVESSESIGKIIFAILSVFRVYNRCNQHGALHLSLIQITPQFVSAALDMR